MSKAVARSKRVRLPNYVFEEIRFTCTTAFSHALDGASKEKALMCMMAAEFPLTSAHEDFASRINFEKAVLILKMPSLPHFLKALVVEYFGKNYSDYFRRIREGQVKSILKNSAASQAKWRKFCQERVFSEDPARHDLASLREFLA